jgi:DNA replication and repair protein RecF
VNHESTELTVYADVMVDESLMPVGVQKSRGGSGVIRIAGETVKSASVLAKQLPLLVINANSFQLIEGSPAQRRQFLDWMVFHVKPEFASLWKGLQKTLKQRNTLLRRDKISYSDIQPWDVEFCRLAKEIDSARKEVFEAFFQAFSALDSALVDTSLGIEMDYIRGWDKDVAFADVLYASFERDSRDGYTHYGPQKADIKLRARQKMASDVLSRGQEKALICAMTITQAHLYKEWAGRDCVFLIDDLLAELDNTHSQSLAKSLNVLNGQVFVTGVSKEGMQLAWAQEKEQKEITVFHVKHGELTID